MRRILLAISLFIAGISLAQTHTVDVQYQTQRMYAAPPYTYQVFTNAAELDTYVTNVPTRAYAGQAVVLVEAGVPTAYTIGGTTGALTLVPVSGSTAWQNPANVTNWTWTSNGSEITITGYTGPNDVVIPDMLDGLPVTGFGTTFSPDYEYLGTPITSVGGGANITSIGSDAFLYCPNLTSVSFPQATSIGSGAFFGCTSLSSVALPNATSIGDYAFQNCPNLTSVSFPQATSIGSGAFFGCTSLSSVALPNATSIGDYAFQNCPNLTSVALPNATSIGSYAFMDCSDLISVALPNATSIGYDAFSHCSNLTSVALPNATSIGSYAFMDCSDLISVALPNATSIGYDAFSHCTSLTSVALPNATSIGVLAFYNCSSLTSVYMGQNAPAESMDVFYDSTPTIYVTNPQATGWGSQWNGRPVVRMPLATDSLTLGGVTRTNWPSGGTSSTTNWIAATVIQSAPTVTITGTMKSPLTLNLTNNTILSFDYASFPPTVTGLVVQAVTYQPNEFSFGLDTNTMSGTLPTPVTNAPNFLTVTCTTGMGTVRAEVR